MLRHRICTRGSSLAVVLALLTVLVSCRPPRHPDEGSRDRDNAAEAAEDEGLFSASFKGAKLDVGSPAFEAGGEYPAEFTCDGESASPPVEWSGAPDGTRSYALNVWHVPGPGGIKSYWLVYDIPPTVTKLPGMRRTSAWMGSTTRDGPATTPCAPGGRDPRRTTSPFTPCPRRWGHRAGD